MAEKLHFLGLHFLQDKYNLQRQIQVHNYLERSTSDSLEYIMDNPTLIVIICMGKSIRIQRVKSTVNLLDCKFGNFREGFIFAKFSENKILAKCRNHSVVY